MSRSRQAVACIVCVCAMFTTSVYIFTDIGQVRIPSPLRVVSLAANYRHSQPFTNAKPEVVQAYRHNHNGSEIRQVVFAKVHKAASSTMQNILLRFAMARNLDVLLPALSEGPILSQTRSKIEPAKIIPHPRGKPFDILCSHVLYDAKEIAKYFPHSAARVAIIREPLHQTLSALTYYATLFPSQQLKAGLRKHPRDPINGFLSHPEHFFFNENNMGPAGSFINNRMSIDLGFELSNFTSSKTNKTKIQAFIEDMDKEFDVVLISDYFDESIVLLRRLLKWTFKEIIYIRVNAVQKPGNASIWSKKPSLNSTQIHTFRQWAAIDYHLYEHFLPIFLNTIQAEPYFQEELKAFKAVQKEVYSFCLNSTNRPSLTIAKGRWTDQFSVTKDECNVMMTDEVHMVKLAKSTQFKRYQQTQKTKHVPAPRV